MNEQLKKEIHQSPKREQKRAGWGKRIAGLILAAVLLYFVVQYEVLFRLFVVLFLAGLAYVVLSRTKEQKPEFQNEPITSVPEPVMANQETIIYEKELQKKEEELTLVDLDRTQLLEELFAKAQLQEAEKQTYREKIRQKDAERSSLLEELVKVKGRFSTAVTETKKYFVKADPLKEVAAAIDQEKIAEGSITSLNEMIKELSSSLTPETIEALKKQDYVDEELNLTRIGYKALRKTMEKARKEG
ncbi:hypothetical protein M3212_07780 [Alkalihalobacillus oceani]|uniref:hypothetical protein n=1 Tax=Halalkalibacter oceani TaxID=1653776 RepID=UPI00203A63F4|nr:hypothetical protein [Halalkalibacter oceani]MCM3760686.1 hypothetical protein [Halalkalibacter oceani]